MVGFSSGHIDAIWHQFLCEICFLIYRNPVQLSCGHRFCRSCIGDQRRMSITCAQCHRESPRSEMFSDRGIENDMNVLDISCSECLWTGLFKDYQTHLARSHSNKSTDSNVKNPVVLKVRRLVEKFDEYRRNFRLFQATVQRFSLNTSAYKMSVEEQNPPGEEMPLQHVHHYVPYDGTLILKMNDVQNKLDNHSVVTSTPFYTTPTGYKMCARIYFNGNGVGQSTHLSVFLVLMRGDYDAVLEWPFHFQVIVGLYDLINRKDHIIEAFQSDRNSISFQQPQTEMNLASGIPKLISREKLLQHNSPYISEGAMYIRIMVREHPIPISVLTDIMNIDFCLPLYMQEEIIEQSIKRKKMPSQKLYLTLKLQQSF